MISYKCAICNKTFLLNEQLSRHMKHAHPVNPKAARASSFRFSDLLYSEPVAASSRSRLETMANMYSYPQYTGTCTASAPSTMATSNYASSTLSPSYVVVSLV